MTSATPYSAPSGLYIQGCTVTLGHLCRGRSAKITSNTDLNATTGGAGGGDRQTDRDRDRDRHTDIPPGTYRRRQPETDLQTDGRGRAAPPVVEFKSVFDVKISPRHKCPKVTVQP